MDQSTVGAPPRRRRASAKATPSTAASPARRRVNGVDLALAGETLAQQVFNLPEWAFEMLPMAAYFCDRDGNIIRYNRRAAEIWGREPLLTTPGESFCGSFELSAADSTPIAPDDHPMAAVLRTGQPAKGIEAIVGRSDGSRRIVLMNINPITGIAGDIQGAVTCFEDISDRKVVEEEERHSRELVEDLSRKLIRESARLRDSERNLESVLANLPAAVYMTDAEGRITYFNEAAVALWGCTPTIGETEFCGSWKIYWPDGTPLPHDECPMAVALKTGEPVRGIDAVAERPDGTRVPFLPYPTPLFDSDGELVGAVNMLLDISERKEAELATQRLAAIVQSSHDAIISKDLNGIIASWNPGAELIFGYSAEEMIGKPVMTIIPTERQEEETEILRRLRAGDHVDHFETVRRRKDGSFIDVSLTVSPIRDRLGRVIGASKIARDITERKRAEQTRELLLHEIKHRVKNSLTTIQSIAAQTFRKGPPEERAAFIARLHSLANAYDLLTRHNWGRAPLSEIVQRAVAPFEEKHHERFSCFGPEGSLDPGKALLLVLILHELGTNAIKYGALSNDAGTVEIEWEITTEGKEGVRLTWREAGGPPVKPPRHKGFGTRLIQNALRHDMGAASFDFSPTGVSCTVVLAL